MGLLSLFNVEISVLTLIARAAIFSTWFVALLQIWRTRHAPLANQAFVASLSIVLVQMLLIFHTHLPIEPLVFFISMAQVILAISVVKIARWAGHLTSAEFRRIHIMEARMEGHEGLVMKYGKIILTVALSGAAYFLLSWMAQGYM